MLLAQTLTANAGTATDLASAWAQIVGAGALAAVALIWAFVHLAKQWGESKSEQLKAEVAKSKAEAELAQLKVEQAKAEMRRAQKNTQTVIKAIEAMPDADAQAQAKDTIGRFSKAVGQYDEIDAVIDGMGLKKSKAAIEIPKEGV